MNQRTLIYVAIGLVVLYLISKKSAAGGVNADMGGTNFGILDPSTW